MGAGTVRSFPHPWHSLPAWPNGGGHSNHDGRNPGTGTARLFNFILQSGHVAAALALLLTLLSLSTALTLLLLPLVAGKVNKEEPHRSDRRPAQHSQGDKAEHNNCKD